MAVELVKSLYLFKEFNANELAQMNRIVKMQVYNPGDEIFSEGDSATSLYLIKMGTVKIQQKSKNSDLITLTTLGSGAHFGEMPFLDGEKRSATASCIEKSEILSLDYVQMRSVLNAGPDTAAKLYRALANFLCGRLRVTTLDLRFAREKNIKHF